MKIFVETERLVLREILPSDDKGLYELDSDPEVHQFLGENPIKTIGEARGVVEYIRSQYSEYGIGRWAVIEKKSGDFIGWAGFKWITENVNNHSHYYDLGYRFIRKYWGKGYATEAARGSFDYGVNQLELDKIFAITHADNHASGKVLEKVGFGYVEMFDYHGSMHKWFEVEKR